MKKLAIIFLGVIVVVWALSKLSGGAASAPSPNAAAEQVQAQQFAQAVAARLKTSAKWEGISVKKATKNDYQLVLTYQSAPANQAEVRRDTKAVAQAAIDELVKQGRQPAPEHIYIGVWAQKPEKGASGQALTRVYGRSVYDYNNDSIEYKAK
ncbi:hypothetical protein [Pseudoxanthomonas sacheonensis]|uniref:hypothetical protein n=1 Tax=Pseudoxanthomonas sacheonensis TaxID=443615 RepID=UPI0013D0B7F8|nr:hypothetical protein [Pseudoxanthomonas sacheonensis]KAF1708650.1 hypothetical protein CSC73_08120 [Pseudoxanthomonas sacheonensis]